MDNYNEITDQKVTQKKLNALKKSYKALEELSAYKPIIRNRNKIVWTENNDYPLKDSCLFFVNGSWMYNIWKQKQKHENDLNKIVPCELPVFKNSDNYIGCYSPNWAVLKNAPHKEEAIKLLMFWCSPQVAEDWVRYTKCPTGLRGNLTTSSFGLDSYESFMYYVEKKYGQKIIAQNENQCIFGNKNYNLSFRVIDVLEGNITAESAYKELAKQLNY